MVAAIKSPIAVRAGAMTLWTAADTSSSLFASSMTAEETCGPRPRFLCTAMIRSRRSSPQSIVDLGCRTLQGYHFGTPQPPEMFVGELVGATTY